MRFEKRNQGLPRVVEICFAAVGLVCSAPVLAVSALLIKFTSKGPVIFRQVRVGKNGVPFTLFKLRTMRLTPGSLVTSANDSRITAFGRLLRRSKIDELPELWNILRGDMSFVGPRPEVPEFVDTEDPMWAEVLGCRPGLTDPVTLRLRNEEQLLADLNADDSFYRKVLQPFKLRGYLQFLRRRTWAVDVRIIYLTLAAVLFRKGVAPPSREEMTEALAE